MKWRWLGGLLLIPAAALAYACSTDSFQNTQGDFCDAEAKYFTHCSYTGACYQQDLTNCGAVYATLNPAVTAAFATCSNAGQIACSEGFTSIVNDTCMQNQLKTFVNDGGAMATLTADYCALCAGGDPGCAAKFAQPNNPGYVPSLFDDTIIADVDKLCTKNADGGVMTPTDAGTLCADLVTICSYYAIGLRLPTGACKDGGF